MRRREAACRRAIPQVTAVVAPCRSRDTVRGVLPAAACRWVGAAVLAIAAPSVLAQAAPAADAGHACLIEPMQRVELRSVVEGRIDVLHVERGAEVRKGQVLVELDSAVERAALEAARFRAVMEGQVRSAQTRVDAGRRRLERREDLVRDQIVAAQERDDALAELRLAEASLVEARDNQRLAELEQRRLTELLEQRRLRSPFTGVVTERLQGIGEVAQAGEGARPILRLAQTHPLRVEVVLPVAMLGRLRPGQRAVVEAEPPLTGRYSATVAIVDRVVDAASGTFGVRLELPNPRGEIPAGVKCRVRFQAP